MTRSKLGTTILALFAAAAVLAPVRFSAAEPITTATAECATCCSESGPLCVVCGKTCVTVQDAYDNGGGACS